MCAFPPYLLCGLWVTLAGRCPADQVCLRPRWGCACWRRTLLCSRQVCFGYLPPGEYVLTLKGCRCVELLARLPPGANAEVRCDPAGGVIRWRRDPFRYCFNQA